MKKTCAIFLILLSSFGLTSCRQKGTPTSSSEAITLVMYGLNDSETLYQPIIQEFKSTHPNVNVTYKKFTDPDDYLDLIINELAEGEGPDIFLMHNSWFPKHYKKLTPAPSTMLSQEQFESLFVEIAHDELIIPNDNGINQIWGVPMYIDTLALYYNDTHIEEAIPTQGRPSDTWSGIIEDVIALNRPDQSFQRFERSGIALGRGDNIRNAFDILMMFFLQHKVAFYDEDFKTVLLDQDPASIEALKLFTSFALPSQRQYSWNQVLADSNSPEQEINTFASGRLSMMLGYSSDYEAILREIAELKTLGKASISREEIKVQEVPQVFPPENSNETREAYASYYVPVVSRTSQNPELAWSFLATLVSPDVQRYFNEETHRPSALRSLIEEQSLDPVYGVFAQQVGYASSIVTPDIQAYKELSLEAIEQVLATQAAETVIQGLTDKLQELVPSSGVKMRATLQ